MIRLNPTDASVLARIAQYLDLPPEKRKQMLDETTTDEARQVGLILVGELDAESPGVSEDVKETAEALRSWSEKSRGETLSRCSAV